jgi:hypothetical protein
MSPPKNGEIPRNRFPDRFGTAKPAIRTAVAPPRQKVKGLLRVSSFHCFTKYVKVTFFRGTSLRPVPPGVSRHKEVRYLDIYEDDHFDEARFAAWVTQASRLPGERM